MPTHARDYACGRGGGSPGMMVKAISYYWRLFATALCFTVFGVSAAIFGMLVFPLMRLLPGEADVHRRRVRATFRVFMRSFVGLMSAVGVLEYEFVGRGAAGAPRADHPGEPPVADRRGVPHRLHAAGDLHREGSLVPQPADALAGGRGGLREQHLDDVDGRARLAGPSEWPKCNSIPRRYAHDPGPAPAVSSRSREHRGESSFGGHAGFHPLRPDDAGEEHAVVPDPGSAGAVLVQGRRGYRSGSVPEPAGSACVTQPSTRTC